jgi:VanZ family protein
MMTKRQVIFGIIAMAVMVMIFGFSAKNAHESTEESLEVGMTIGKVTVKDFKKLPYPEQVRFAEKIDHMVRKSAHFLEYTVLGFVLFFTLYGEKLKRVRAGIFGWITGTLYAVTDEIHQMFVPGRACMFTDVCIDSGGVLTGTLLSVLILGIILAVRHRKGMLSSEKL